MIKDGICEFCGSDRGGFLCRCGEVRCICERGECIACQRQREYEDAQTRYEAEQEEREWFENEMQEKYH